MVGRPILRAEEAVADGVVLKEIMVSEEIVGLHVCAFRVACSAQPALPFKIALLLLRFVPSHMNCSVATRQLHQAYAIPSTASTRSMKVSLRIGRI